MLKLSISKKKTIFKYDQITKDNIEKCSSRALLKQVLSIPGVVTRSNLSKRLFECLSTENECKQLYAAWLNNAEFGVIASINIGPLTELVIGKDIIENGGSYIKLTLILRGAQSIGVDLAEFSDETFKFLDTAQITSGNVGDDVKEFNTLGGKTDPIDLSNQQVRLNFLQGIFPNTLVPSFTGIQMFLKTFHSNNKTPSYIATKGTIPTETVLVYSNVTYSIVKMMDGKYYRLYIAETDPGYDDPSFVATHDVDGRWFQLCADVQNRNFSK